MGIAPAASIGVFLSAPSDETSFLAGVGTTDTFGNGTATSTTSFTGNIGTYTSTSAFNLARHDQYGGAGGTGRYMVFGAQSGSSAPITITLNASETYLGMWFSAADANNGISFYNGSTLIGRFSTSNLLTLLGNTTVTAINSTTYTSASYLGNPDTGQDATEPFAYLDFFANGTTFNKIVLDNSGLTVSGFETDNYTVYGGVTTAPGGDVFIVSVPEPSQYAVMLGGLLFCLVGGQRMVKSLRLRFQT